MKKNQLPSLLKRVLLIVSTVVLALGLSACSLFQGESIDGNWTSESGAKELLNVAIESAQSVQNFTYSEHSFKEFFPSAELNMTIKDDKAELEVVMHIKREEFYKAIKDEMQAAVESELKKQGLTYGGLSDADKASLQENLYTDEQLRKLVEDSFEGMAKVMSGTYDKDKEVVSTTVFKADVNRSSKMLEITKANGTLGSETISAGEQYEYSYKK